MMPPIITGLLPVSKESKMKPEDTLKRNKYYHCLEYDHDQTGELCLISCGLEQCDGGVCYGSDVKDYYCLHAVLSGTGVLRINGQILHPRANQLFLLKEGELAEYIADEHDPWKYCWVGFKGDEAYKMCDYIGFTDGIQFRKSHLPRSICRGITVRIALMIWICWLWECTARV